MKNKFFKSLALALSFATVLSTLPVNAYELDSQGMSVESVEYQNSEDDDFVNASEVFAEIGSTYQVTIPKVIVLSGESKSAQYQVSAEGDIAGYETIFVRPDRIVNLYSVNKDMQIGTITQDKTGWTNNTIDVIGNGLIKADGITAGKWSGTFNFEIFLNLVLGDVIAPDHVHNPGEAQVEALIQPDCETPGSYDEVFYCTDCYAELSREAKEIPALGHDYVNGYCSRCGAVGFASVNFVVNGETVAKDVKIGEKATDLTLADFDTEAPAFYTFAGWSTSPTSASVSNVTVTEDDLTTPLTLYAVQKHTHTGTNGTTSPNGCYNEAYSNYEVTGTTTVNKWRCTVCGAEGWGAPYIGDTQHGNMWTVIDSRTENSYGYRTRYRCTKTDKIG